MTINGCIHISATVIMSPKTPPSAYNFNNCVGDTRIHAVDPWLLLSSLTPVTVSQLVQVLGPWKQI